MAQRIRIGSKLLLARGLVVNGLLAAASLGLLVAFFAAPGDVGLTDRLQWLLLAVGTLAGLGYSLWAKEVVEYVDLADWVTIKGLLGTRSLPWEQIMALQFTQVAGRNNQPTDYLHVRPAHGRSVTFAVTPFQKTEIIEFMRRTQRGEKLL